MNDLILTPGDPVCLVTNDHERGRVLLTTDREVLWRDQWGRHRKNFRNAVTYCPDEATIELETSRIREAIGLPPEDDENERHPRPRTKVPGNVRLNYHR